MSASDASACYRQRMTPVRKQRMPGGLRMRRCTVMPSIEIPQEYWAFLFLRCAELGVSPEEYMERLINSYLERIPNNE